LPTNAQISRLFGTRLSGFHHVRRPQLHRLVGHGDLRDSHEIALPRLRRHRALHVSSDDEIDAWSLRSALGALAVATIATALVAEILVGSLEAFADKAGLSDFFVAAVVVAIVGNAAEHGGAVLVAHRGKIALAGEIALSSAAQVAVFLIPAVALLSWLLEPLALSFRPVEIAALGGSVLFTAIVLFDGRSSRVRGALLLAGYAVVVVAFLAAGDR